MEKELVAHKIVPGGRSKAVIRVYNTPWCWGISFLPVECIFFKVQGVGTIKVALKIHQTIRARVFSLLYVSY